MPCIFNPGYIGPTPPCCDTDCLDEDKCTVPECGVCSEHKLPCCFPARPPKNLAPKCQTTKKEEKDQPKKSLNAQA
ncbi:hypothetical protein KR018_004596 [Drosophila ironensis]|nr:hypothetical protein KR018_004596 [Drosophila ironensis]